MNKWQAGNYQGSGLSKSQFQAKSLLGKVNEKLAQRQAVQQVKKPQVSSLAQKQAAKQQQDINTWMAVMNAPEFTAAQQFQKEQKQRQAQMPDIKAGLASGGLTQEPQKSLWQKTKEFAGEQASNIKWAFSSPRNLKNVGSEIITGKTADELDELRKKAALTPKQIEEARRGIITKLTPEQEESQKELAQTNIQGIIGMVGGEEGKILKPALSEIKSAAVKVGKNIYEGASHAEAIKAAQKAGETISMADKEAKGLFKLKSGELITRDEAEKTFGIRSSSEVPHLKAKQESPLIQEAKKYKSAEEFVNYYSKNKGEIPTTPEYQKFLKEKDAYVKREDEIYAEMKAMREKYADKTINDVPKSDITKYDNLQKELNQTLSKKTLAPVPEGVIKTHIGDKGLQSQLTDIWNKANKSRPLQERIKKTDIKALDDAERDTVIKNVKKLQDEGKVPVDDYEYVSDAMNRAEKGTLKKDEVHELNNYLKEKGVDIYKPKIESPLVIGKPKVKTFETPKPPKEEGLLVKARKEKLAQEEIDKANRQLGYIKQGQARAAAKNLPKEVVAKREAERTALFGKDVQKTFEQATVSKPKIGKNLVSAVRDLFNPVHGVKEGTEIKNAFREHAATFRHDVAKETKLSEKRANFWNKIDKTEQLNFIHSIETGKPIGNDAMFNEYKQAFERDYKIMESINPDAPYRKDYFTHNGLWADPKKATEFYNKWAKEQFGGGKKFFKARTFPTVYDGLKAGLELKETNPEKLFLNNHTNVLKAKMADDFTKEMAAKGMPEGAVQAVIDRYMDRGLKNNAIYRTVAEANSGLNMFQLGLSAFHFTTTSVNSIVSKAALAAKELTQGRILQAGKHTLETPFSIFTDFARGSKAFKDNPQLEKNIATILRGGGTVERGGGYHLGEWGKMKDSFKKGNIVSGTFRLPFAVMEKAASPLMDVFVPRLKVGSYLSNAASELERLGVNATQEEQRRILAKVWDSTDNRFGQLVQDNLMWNQTFKDVLNVDTRSLGWNFGTIRELGGGVTDLLKPSTYKGLAKGEGISDRTAYAITLPLVTAGIATVIMKMQGQTPQTALDFVYPRTGEKTKQGYDERLSIPGYMKDVFSYKANPVQTLINKQSAIANVMAKIVELGQTGGIKDYYGNWVVDPYAPLEEKSKQFAKFSVSQFLPFSVSGQKQRTDQSMSAAAKSFMGFQPAPAAITKGSEVTDLANMWRDIAPAKPKTPAEAAAFDEKMKTYEAKTAKTPEQAKKELDFLKSLRSQKPDSEERRQTIQDYMNTLSQDERKSMNYKLSVLAGISTKGVSTSDDVIAGKPLYQKFKELDDAGKTKEADQYEASLSDKEYKQFSAAKKSAAMQATNALKAEKGDELKAKAEQVAKLESEKNYDEIEKIEAGMSDEEYKVYYSYLKKL